MSKGDRGGNRQYGRQPRPGAEVRSLRERVWKDTRIQSRQREKKLGQKRPGTQEKKALPGGGDPQEGATDRLGATRTGLSAERYTSEVERMVTRPALTVESLAKASGGSRREEGRRAVGGSMYSQPTRRETGQHQGGQRD